MNAGRGRGMAAASLEIIDAAYTILEEIQPATVRAVCYRLFAAELIPNMGKNSTGKVSRLLVAAREDALIPWAWIVDETRAPERIASWEDPESILRAAVQQYRKDYWADQAARVEVWSEKGTVRGTIAPVLQELGVTFRVLHGYGSATSVYSAAQDSVADDKPLTVLYVGDFDPSGLHMSEVDLPGRIARYDGDVQFHRIALTAQDVAPGTTIPHFEVATKAKDPRFQWFRARYGLRCWELDALSPLALRQRVRDAIMDRMDLSRWARAVDVEAAERESMQGLMEIWHRSISRQVSKYPEGQP